MLTGIALAHRTSDMLTANVLPRPAVRVIDPGFTALFDGTANTFNSWKSADAKNGQGFALIDGEIATYGSAEIGRASCRERVEVTVVGVALTNRRSEEVAG